MASEEQTLYLGQGVYMVEEQIVYLGRWVNKNSFRAYVYNQSGKKIANSYKEYENLISSGLWFSEYPVKKRKLRNQKEVIADGGDS